MAPNREVNSHTGLGVSALNIAKSLELGLKGTGVKVTVQPVFDGYELRDKVLSKEHYTHVVMFAPWLDTPFLQSLVRKFPNTHFVVTCHSNVGFLQADAYAVQLMREQMELELSNHNFSLAANSSRLVEGVKAAFHRPCLYLPNLYHADQVPVERPLYRHGSILRIGIFGAIRAQKNLLSAAWAAVIIANTLKTECEISLSSGREEGGYGVLRSIRQLTKNVKSVKLVETGWLGWSQFRTYVKDMHLLVSPSYTESFCNVVADGIMEGVPGVVSPAINWVPKNWMAEPDDVNDIANVGMRLLGDRKAVKNGFNALNVWNEKAIRQWAKFLEEKHHFNF